jgi:hypothetical protein
MEISIETSCYLGINFTVGALSAYHTPYPYQWLAAFAAGVLAGTFQSTSALNQVKNGYDHIWSWSKRTDNEMREEGVNYLLHSTPGFFSTMIHCVALAVITKSAPFLEPYGSRYESYISGFAAFSLGYRLAHLFALDRLSRIKDPQVTPFLQDAVI